MFTTGETETQSILRCGLCNKPFDKQSTLKRHGYYCRSRRTGNTVRSRSCIPCAKAKARCDNRRPECSRCVGRVGECRYPAGAGAGPRRSPKPSSSEDSDSIPSISSSGESENWDGSQAGRVIQDAETTDVVAPLGLGFEVGGGYLPWDDLDVDFADFLSSPMNTDFGANIGIKDIQHPPPHSSILPRTPPDPPLPMQTPNKPTSIPPLMATFPRLLIPRPNPKPGTQRTTTLIQHTLKSYLMELRHDTLPPFIHHLSVTANAADNLTGPLSKCINWIRTISSEGTSRTVFWTNVRVECEQLCAEYSKLDRWGLLSAMQALAVYILVRIDEGETEHNNLDFLLLATVTVLAKQLTWDSIEAILPQTQGQLRPQPQSQTERDNIWTDWVIEESRRRLAIIYRIINMLVYFEPAARCDLPKDLIMAPLPAKKQLWEAPGSSTWKQEVDREPDAQTAFGLAATGELVRLEVERDAEQGDAADGDRSGDRDRSRDKSRERGRGKVLTSHEDLLLHKPTNTNRERLVRSTASWEEWCEGMDGLGGIVLLVASLVA